jgi:hypothetical protein
LRLIEWVDAARTEPRAAEIKARGVETRLGCGIARWRPLFAAPPCIDNALRHEATSVRAEPLPGAGLDRGAGARPRSLDEEGRRSLQLN